ncbi:MAG: hypothetical protein GEU90_09635 [Gemmatimonas sp.]|nr:hypothetical protein [Gemmatimonas sp.]
MKRVSPVRFSLLATMIVAAPLAAQSKCENRREISETLDLAPTDRIRVEAGAGSLRITGRPGMSQVLVTGTACASSASRLEEMEIDIGSRAGEAYVETIIPQSLGWFDWFGYARMDLVVEVPEGATLNVRDGSGSLEIANIGGGLKVDDGSGSLEIANVGGGLEVDDGSGSLTIRDVDGDLRLFDGSGSITVENVRGSVVVEDDGSGSMDVRNVTGSVFVREDGSGSISVDLVGGDFIVDRDGSGGIHSADIAGVVQIPRRR